MKSLVIEAEELDPVPSSWLAARCRVERCGAGEARFGALVAEAEGLIVRSYTRVDGSLLSRAPRLRVVGRAGIALESIDVPACRARGVEVVHTPGANTRAVVEYVAALLADALRPRVYLDRAVPDEQWHRYRRELVAPRQMDEMTLGIWGFGRIGSAVARLGAALDMRVIYHELLDIPPEQRAGAMPVGVDRLLAESDALTIHVDYRESNRGLLAVDALARLKPDVLILNTSRGLVVDHAALADFLRASPRATAVIDVHDPGEPIRADHPLLGLPNARLTPHLAACTETAKRNMSWVVRDVWRVLNGEKPEWPAPTLE
ncbi:MAG: NAD(P)-dependent oxidoreductase [Phycisphaerales bacterium]